MTYFHHGRECTIEISDISLLPAAQLPVMWEYNYRSLLNYMKQACLGLSGVVTDSLTGEPLKARILIEGHDFDSSHVYSSLPAGNYHRLLYQGSYDITVRAPGYFPKVLEGVGITNGQPTVQDVQLVAGDLIAYFSAENTTVQVGSSVQFHDESSGDIQSWYWVFEGGDPATSAEPDPLITYTDEGEYDVTLTVTGGAGSNTFTRSSYIHSAHIYSMQNGTASVCSGKFFDSGGPNGHYGNYQNLVMTLYPAEPGKRLRIVFVDFNMEYDPECSYDYLRIFDGTTTTAPLIGEYCGYLSPGAVEATSASGALTFFFHSDGNVTAQGWEADISCETIVGMETPGVMEPEIYPNPAGDRIRIKNGASAGERVVYRIYTNDGIPVFEEEKWTAVPEDEIKIPPLPGGIYILQIIAGERIAIKKIVLF
jgi:PKD repeat protein